MTAPMSTRSARTVLWADAGLDTTIALLCVLVTMTADGGAWARPGWLGPTVLLVLAAVLVGLAVLLLFLAKRPDAIALMALGAGNGVSGVVVLAWALLDASAGSALRAAAAVVGFALVRVAAVLFVLARRL